MSRPRLGIVLTELGLVSEIWALRQARAFESFEPVFFAWSARAGGWHEGAGIETHLFRTPFARPVTPWVRAGWRLGAVRSILPPRTWLQDLRGTLAGAGLDGVLCHFAWNAIPVVEALRREGIPAAAQVHGRDVSMFLRNRAYRAALRRTLPRLRFLAAVGRFQLETLRPYGLPPAHAAIPCGAPLADFAAAPPPERAEGEALRLISVGRLSDEKGVRETLEAAREAAARLPVEWTCIGDGALAEPLRRAAAEAEAATGGALRVRLPGAQAPERIAEALARSHVFTQHSRPADGWIEGFGVSLTEAGAAGLPLVASDLGGIPDQVEDGANGFLFAPGDAAAQAAAILRLADDEALRRRMGAAARRTAARFDAAALARRLEDALLPAFS